MAAPRDPAEGADPMAALLHDRVVAAVGDRFDVEAELGRGGMAVVYRAREVRLRRLVALKVLPPELAYRRGVRERFLREAQTAAQLAHPNIVPVYAADETQGVAWLAMAYVPGETLAQRLARGPLPVDAARRLLAEVADALAYAHARGVVHRDVKPDNILLDADSGRAMVMDFGIARAAEEDQRLTVTGVAVGTPAYMSPEQALGESDVDGRSDLYSLGVVGYQALTGVLPFEATSATALLMKHVGEHARPVRERAPHVPAALAEAVERALAKKPDGRWPDAATFRRALLDPAVPPARPAPDAAGPTVAVPGLAREPRPIDGRHQLLPPPPPLPPAPPPPRLMPPPDPPDAPPPVAEPFTSRDQWRAQRREWKERQREARRASKAAYQQAYDQAMRGGAGLPVPASAPRPPRRAPLPAAQAASDGDAALLVERAASWRSKAIGTLVLVAFLAVINVTTSPGFPWVIFPAWGMLAGLAGRGRPLRAAGVQLSGVLVDGPEAAVAQARASAGSLEPMARRFRRGVMGMLVAVVVGFLALAIGEGELVPLAAIALFAFVFLGVRSLRDRGRLRRRGVPIRAVLSRDWRETVALADPRPREEVLRAEAARLGSEAVLAGRHGPSLLGAIEDRLVVRETLARLSPADRALIPDVLPTVDALVEKVAGLVQALHRLDDVPDEALVPLDARLAALRAAAAGPDRDRTLQLLERQRASVADLLARRAALAAQLESAQLVLQNVKLDLLKLRAAGVGALAEPTGVTQEARALSRDIRYALEAAAEVRGN